MPLAFELPSDEFLSNRRFNAHAFDIDILRGWAKRKTQSGHAYWIHRGRHVSIAAIQAFGVQEAWELAEKPQVLLGTTTHPWTVGPA